MKNGKSGTSGALGLIALLVGITAFISAASGAVFSVTFEIIFGMVCVGYAIMNLSS